ncbi:hypothetical protein D3273_26220 [Lichenibacterium minor]|uniref:Uncharacterized protein n=1 Tax=Lichenibacterium minor TaxID=2316528 RepID=A0A4Q2TY56_9HYPH|nr:hypothetical protein [Lichenibacterium minor]RYC29013.1 hypothetical protein D3273_26220 [Lichenibacterium minor]
MDPAATYEVVDGKHSFPTDIPGQRVTISMALTGRQLAFLLRNPAAARCCLLRGWLTSSWLDQLIAATEATPEGVH